MQLTNITIKAAPVGRHFDGDGLWLTKTANGGSWKWRYQINGRRREIGLGPYPAIGLSEARKARRAWAAVLAEGKDPIEVRDARKADEQAQRDKVDPTFADMTQIVFEGRKDSLRGSGTRGRWLSPLLRHVHPIIGSQRISQIHQTDIVKALKPIWRNKHPTAKKAIERTRIIFRQAQLMGYDCDVFTVEAAQHMLGVVDHKAEHIAATPWQDIPALYAKLDGGFLAHECLRFMILTLVRSDGCRGARQSEIKGDVWTVPTERVKGTKSAVKDFRCPLPQAALDIAARMRIVSDDLLFPGERLGQKSKDKYLSDAALSKALNKIGESGRPHGLRTSFRTWVQDTDACSYEVSETILGHVVGGKVERSYARSDLLDRRRIVLNKWADYVTGESASVIKLRG